MKHRFSDGSNRTTAINLLLLVSLNAAIQGGCAVVSPGENAAASNSASASSTLYQALAAVSPTTRATLLDPIMNLSMPQYYSFLQAADLTPLHGALLSQPLARGSAFYRAAAAYYPTIGSFWQAGGYQNQPLSREAFQASSAGESSNELGLIDTQPCQLKPDRNQTRCWELAAKHGVTDPDAVAAALNQARCQVLAHYQFAVDQGQQPQWTTGSCDVPDGSGAFVIANVDAQEDGTAKEYWCMRKEQGPWILGYGNMRKCMQDGGDSNGDQPPPAKRQRTE